MQITRQDFLKKLSVVKPGLATEPIIPITTYVWFTGAEMMTFNDIIAISVPFETDFKGAVPGALLINTLESSFAKNVKLEVLDNHAKLTAGKTNCMLPFLLPSAFIFKMPKLVDGIGIDDDHKIFPAMSDCLISVGNDYTDANQLGITFIQDDKSLHTFATNRKTMSHSRISDTQLLTPGKQVLLPSLFCEQMLAMRSKEMIVQLGSQHAMFNSGGNVTLWGRYIRNDKPYNFVQLLNRYLPPDARRKMSVLPDNFKQIISRALYVAEDAKTQRTEIIVEDARARMNTKSEKGVMHDVFDLPDHAPAQTVVSPKFLKSAASLFDKVLVTEPCLILANKNTTYMVASNKGSE